VKKALKVLIIVVLALVVAVIGALLAMDTIARKGIEAGATKALGVQTRVGAVHISLLRSNVTLTGLQIANPPGYKGDTMMSLKMGSVTASVPSLLSKVVVVDAIILDAPEVNLESKGIPPKTNLGEVVDTMNASPPKPEEKQAQKQYRIGLIRISDTKVHVSSAAGKAEVVLPLIELKDVNNSDGSPVVLADVLSKMLRAMAESVLKNVGAQGVLEIPKELEKPFKALPGLRKK